MLHRSEIHNNLMVMECKQCCYEWKCAHIIALKRPSIMWWWWTTNGERRHNTTLWYTRLNAPHQYILTAHCHVTSNLLPLLLLQLQQQLQWNSNVLITMLPCLVKGMHCGVIKHSFESLLFDDLTLLCAGQNYYRVLQLLFDVIKWRLKL